MEDSKCEVEVLDGPVCELNDGKPWKEENPPSPELKEREARILTARDDLNQLEYEIFVALREEVGGQAEVIRNISRAVAAADVLCGLAELAVYQGYCRPEMVEGREHSEKVDYWALGVLTYEFICGNPPFEDLSGHNGEVFEQIERSVWTHRLL